MTDRAPVATEWWPSSWRVALRAHVLTFVVQRLTEGLAHGIESASWEAWTSDERINRVEHISQAAIADLRVFHDRLVSAYVARFVTGARVVREGGS